MNENNQTGIFEVLSGRESIKVDIGIDWITLTVLVGAILTSGTLLIFISKKM